jgi:hypothetical protein
MYKIKHIKNGTYFKMEYGPIKNAFWRPGDNFDVLKELESREKQEIDMQTWRKRELKKIWKEARKTISYYERSTHAYKEGLKLLRKEIVETKKFRNRVNSIK